ncbi:MAG: undecaprenyl-diphosphate phosphatase [Bacilli bacterium]|nr:undecaprenyl-diphosphate phosphatase [Bacilli bacterium]
MINIVLGIVQGFTEALPISSSGHLYIISKILGKDISSLTIEIMANTGSLIAVIIYYRHKIKDIFLDKNYIIKIVIGTIPAVMFGLLFKDILESNINTKLIGIAFIITSLFLYLVKDKNGEKNNVSILDSLIIGLYQAVALVPGISRSGSTIIGGLNQNLERETAFDYSFMLYIPISIGSLVLGIEDVSGNINEYLVIIVVSAIFTYISIILFSKVIKNGKLLIFSIYTLVLGLITFFII